MLFFKYVGYFLEKFIDGNPGLKVTFLSHSVQFLEVGYFENILIYQVFEKLL